MSKQHDFEKLKSFWYKKLKDEGFVDIETNERLLTGRSNKFTAKETLKSYKQKEEYYYMASHFLNTYDFETNLDKTIWEYHTNGISTRDIATTLKKAGFQKMGRGTVWKVVKSLRLTMNRLYVSK